MPRRVTIAISAERTEAIHVLMRLPSLREAGSDPGISITSSEVASVVAPGSMEWVTRESSEATWAEMETAIAKQSNMTKNSLLLSFLAGILAAVGLTINAIDVVIAAMVIAPLFEPLSRIALSVAYRQDLWRPGVKDTLTGYVALVLGAAAGALALNAAGYSMLDLEPSLVPRVLSQYSVSTSFPSLLASAAAAFAGGLIIAMNRSVLTAGVMIALVLVPTASLVGMGVVLGDFPLAGKAALRWAADAVMVVLGSWLVYLWRHHSALRRGVS